MVVRVDLKGSSREIGVQHGQALRAQITSQIAFYGEMFKERCNLEWPQVLELSQEFRPTFQKLAPDLLEEMEGIAEGVDNPNVGSLDIIALNCRSEIALGRWTDGCTSLGWNVKWGPRKQFLGQNWDWSRAVRENLALMSIERKGKPKIHMVTEAGIIGKIGFNSRSVGVCLNAIRARPMKSSLLPIHALLRRVLESNSVDSAITELKELGGCACSAHMLIADPEGSKGVEISPLSTEIIDEDEDGIVVHTNHFLLNRSMDEPTWLEDSPLRIKRMRELCAEVSKERRGSPAVTVERLRSLFRDRKDSPGSICRHDDPKEHLESLFNIMMDLEEGDPKAEVVFGIGSKDEEDMVRLP